jgi:hypothetical protein
VDGREICSIQWVKKKIKSKRAKWGLNGHNEEKEGNNHCLTRFNPHGGCH